MAVGPLDEAAFAVVGGTGRSFSLQPLSIQGQTGLNFAAGVTTRRGPCERVPGSGIANNSRHPFIGVGNQ